MGTGVKELPALGLWGLRMNNNNSNKNPHLISGKQKIKGFPSLSRGALREFQKHISLNYIPLMIKGTQPNTLRPYYRHNIIL